MASTEQCEADSGVVSVAGEITKVPLDKEVGEIVVTWDGPHDPENPLNWSNRRKWTNVILTSFQACLTPIASTLLAVGALAIAEDFHLTNTYVISLPVALFILGNGLGPLYLAPLSELYGRRIIYITSFSLFSIFNLGCALSPNITALSILRLLSGMAGSAASTLSGASVGDMFKREERGKAQTIYGAAPLFGPVLGGVIGGFVVYGTNGWRWLNWIMVIAPGTSVILCVFFLRETYGPFLLRQKFKRLRTTNGGTVCYKDDTRKSNVFARAITRPIRLLLFAPICSLMSIYISLIYGILYLHLITLPLLFGPKPLYNLFSYQWQNGTTGLSYLGAGTGAIVGIFICAKYLNRSYAYMTARMSRKNGFHTPQPEARLPFMQIGMILGPAGLTIFAWSAEAKTHWVVPLLGAAVFAIGMLMAYICIQTYLVDTFEEYAASALAGLVVSRSVVACILSIVGFHLYQTLGYAWGTMLLTFLLIVMIPIPMIFYVYGPRLRKKNPLKVLET